MKFDSIEIPEELLKAQFEKRLVIFAGAGVSMAEPSCLQSFEGLANQIARNTGIDIDDIEKEKKEFDRYFGRLEEMGIDARSLVKDQLSKSDSKPNILQKSILRIFGNYDDVRVVTTNYDNLFNAASREIFETIPEETFAPAFLNGDDFKGIVYLHGSFSKPLERMVLTDKDFGKGYLTEGWARRFLIKLFSKYDVLFLGYSYDDIVLRYLTRGLPPDSTTKKYILTSTNSPEKWDSLNLEPILYKNEDKKFRKLYSALKSWADHSQREILDHAEKIKRMVSSPPQVSDEDEDYIIKFVFQTKDAIRYFIKYARGFEWLKWCYEKGLLKPLFSTNELTEENQYVSNWVCEFYLNEYSFQIITFAMKENQILNEGFASDIVLFLSLDRINPEYRAKRDLVSLVLSQRYKINGERLTIVLDRCDPICESKTCLLLYKELLRPRIKFEDRYRFSEEKEEYSKDTVSYAFDINGDSYWLKDSINKIVSKNEDYFLPRLYLILLKYIEEMYILSETEDSTKIDMISYRRNSFEKHSQNFSHNDGFQTLFDFFSMSCEWVSLNDYFEVFKILDHFSKSSLKILKRTAVYICGNTIFLDSDEKLEWLIENDVLYDSDCHHELFEILRNCFKYANDECKKLFLRELLKGPEKKDKDRKYDAYKMYKVVAWICRYDSDFVDGVKVAQKFEEKYTFSLGDHPEFTSYVSSGWSDPRPTEMTKEELLKINLGNKGELDKLLDHTDKDRFGSVSNEGVRILIQEVVKSHPNWGMKLATEMYRNKNYESKFWKSVFRGWREALLDTEIWSKIIKFLDGAIGSLSNYSKDISDLLFSSVKEEAKKIDSSLYDLLFLTSKTLWEIIKNKDVDYDIDHWLTVSINSEGGVLAELWVYLLSDYRKENKQFDHGDMLKFFTYVIDHKTVQSKLASCIFCSQLYFLFAVDEKWTAKNLIPLFNFDDNMEFAPIAWDGYISQGRWHKDMLKHLIPVFKTAFGHIESFNDFQDRFIDFVAAIAIHGFANPLEDSEWIPSFLRKSNNKLLEQFASSIASMLRSNNAAMNYQLKVWDNWLKTYWVNRIKGVPIPLQAVEGSHMLEWSNLIGDRISESVPLIEKTNFDDMERTWYFHELEERKVYEKYAHEVLDILIIILPTRKQGHFPLYDLDKIVPALIANHNLPKEKLIKLCNELAKLGSSKSEDWKSEIGQRSNGVVDNSEDE